MTETMYESKRELRRAMLSKRRTLPLELARTQHRSLVDLLAQALPEGATVGSYASFDGEISVDGLQRARPDLAIAWPRVDVLTGLMNFAFAERLPEARGAFGIREPESEETVPPVSFDVMLVPGVAFSASGTRLGMGKGFYDRFLLKLRSDAVKLGICYDWQITQNIPEEPHDIRMDAIATNAKLLSCDGAVEPIFGR